MPLPDAKPSTRIYELLKTTDLENITFSQFQGVAEKIFAEQGAEDELRRIVLVNLARLSVVGEWTGLTSAGGGGSAGMPLTQLYPGGVLSTQAINYVATYYIGEGFLSSSNWCAANTGDNVSLWPFTGGPGGVPNSFSINCTATGTGDVKVVIYNVGDHNEPTSILAQANLGAFSTTGVKSWSPGVTLEQDKLYYFGIMSITSADRPSLSLAQDDFSYALWGNIGTTAAPLSNQVSFQLDTTVNGVFDDPAQAPLDGGSNPGYYDGTLLMSLQYQGTA